MDHKEPDPKAIGFVLPNEPNSLPLSIFAVPVDQVEQVTDLDFFYTLPDNIEERLESVVNTGAWEEDQM